MNININECIKIENYIKDINKINESIQKCKSMDNIIIKFSPEENEMSEFINTIQIFGNIYNPLENLFTKYNIIKKEEIDLILSWLDKKPVKFKLLLDSNTDGDKTSTFEKKCSNVSPTMVFIKSTDGFRFGGFTSKPWGKNQAMTDEKCFLFSLDFKEKYPISDISKATLFEYNYFSFGSGLSLYLYDGCCSSRNDNHTCSSYFNFPRNRNGMNGNKEWFKASSYEVYQIEY